MDKKSVLTIIERFKDSLELRKIKIAKIILFGSFAAGTSNADSDIDLIVISDDFATMSYWERIDFLSAAIYDVFEPIEAISFTTSEWETSHSFLTDYARTGQTVYAA